MKIMDSGIHRFQFKERPTRRRKKAVSTQLKRSRNGRIVQGEDRTGERQSGASDRVARRGKFQLAKTDTVERGSIDESLIPRDLERSGHHL
jgi:hypothetical protein